MSWKKKTERDKAWLKAQRLIQKHYIDNCRLDDLFDWAEVPAAVRRSPGHITVLTAHAMGYDLMLTQHPQHGATASFRKFRVRGIPFRRIGKYPTIADALKTVLFDFSQLLLEIENAKPGLADAREIPGPSVRYGRANRSGPKDSVHPPTPS